MNDFKTPFSSLKNKTGKHKDWYGPEFVSIFCGQINQRDKFFSSKGFIKDYCLEHSQLELKERLNLIVSLLNRHLDKTYIQKLKILRPLLGAKLPYEEGMFSHCFFLYPVSQFVELHASENTNSLDTSLRFIEELTMRFTGEWAIRPLANLYEKKVLSQMKLWARHENFHVRRLASEGLRARLPWGKKIDWIDEDPKKSLPIYSKLRNDPVLYVRRSVANSMGDMIKMDEALAYNTFCQWLEKKKTKENLWVIKHAIRTPVKKKQKKFLALKAKLEVYIKSL